MAQAASLTPRLSPELLSGYASMQLTLSSSVMPAPLASTVWAGAGARASWAVSTSNVTVKNQFSPGRVTSAVVGVPSKRPLGGFAERPHWRPANQ